jgi:putative transcriptional regulator
MIPPLNLKGKLLLAAPCMRDPNFARSVLFLANHTMKAGAFGYVLNRPLDKVVSDLLPAKGLGDLAAVPVYLGGPVEADKLAFASLYWSDWEDKLHCETHLSVNEALHELAIGHEVRGFIGYSGWTSGQLERELKLRSWISTSPQAQVLSTDEPKKLWAGILNGMGPKFELIARMPVRPELN